MRELKIRLEKIFDYLLTVQLFKIYHFGMKKYPKIKYYINPNWFFMLKMIPDKKYLVKNHPQIIQIVSQLELPKSSNK